MTAERAIDSTKHAASAVAQGDSRPDVLPDAHPVLGQVSGDIPAAGSDGQASSRPKVKRPRPCFEDGALTRNFKFPSKTYPKSSYYMTSTEVIVRIRKAKKRWKLVVPKKRIVSYRTNRWFAKPRWVELELTFTQATRLGLVVAPPKAVKSASEIIPDTAPLDSAPLTDELALAADMPEAPSDAEAAPDVQLVLDSDPDTDDGDLDEDTVSDAPPEQLSLADADDVRAVAPLEPLLETKNGTVPEREVPPKLPSAVDIAPVQPALAASQLQASQANSTSGAWRRGIAAALLLALLAGGWQAFVGLAGLFPHDTSTCADACAPVMAQTAVAVPVPAPLSSPEPSSQQRAEERPALPSVLASVPEAAPASPVLVDKPETAVVAAIETIKPNATPLVSEDPEPQRIVTSSVASVAPLTPSTSETSISESCRQLQALATSTFVRFDYASARIETGASPALATLAQALPSCPLMRLRIEGHTDSDGHEERNEKLSWLRAEAVWRQLYAIKVRPEQMAVAGYGQSRPAAPNNSIESKRANRRVTFAVSLEPERVSARK